jgi:hypothetical protein
MRLAAISQIDEHRISDEVKSYLARNILRVEIAQEATNTPDSSHGSI